MMFTESQRYVALISLKNLTIKGMAPTTVKRKVMVNRVISMSPGLQYGHYDQERVAKGLPARAQ
jgi:hypothetical protein